MRSVNVIVLLVIILFFGVAGKAKAQISCGGSVTCGTFNIACQRNGAAYGGSPGCGAAPNACGQSCGTNLRGTCVCSDSGARNTVGCYEASPGFCSVGPGGVQSNCQFPVSGQCTTSSCNANAWTNWGSCRSDLPGGGCQQVRYNNCGTAQYQGCAAGACTGNTGPTSCNWCTSAAACAGVGGTWVGPAPVACDPDSDGCCTINTPPPGCTPSCGASCGQADGCGGTCSNAGTYTPDAPTITSPADLSTVATINPATITLTWSTIQGIQDYEIEAIPSGGNCASAGAYCGNCNSLGANCFGAGGPSFTFAVASDHYTMHVRSVNAGCYGYSGQVYRSVWSPYVTVLVVSPISGRVFYDPNRAATVVSGLCTTSDPAVVGTDTGQAGGLSITNTDSSSGLSYSYGIASDGTFTSYLPYDTAGDILSSINLTPNPYVCRCPANCAYGGIRAPMANVNFYLQLARDAWFQVEGGPTAAAVGTGTSIYNPIPTTCGAGVSTCRPYLIRQNSSNTSGSSAYAMTGGGAVDLRTDNGAQNTLIDQDGRNMNVTLGADLDQYNYAYFRSLYDFPENPVSDFGGSNPAGDAQLPSVAPANANVNAYYYDGSQGAMTIQDAWTVPADTSYVIFVNGDLNINNTIDVANTGFLAFFVTGNITVDNTVGQVVTAGSVPATTGVVEGVYVANGQIIIESRGAGLLDRRFVGEGSFVGWSGVDLQRNYDDGTSNTLLNEEYPVEIFRYRPDFVINAPSELRVPNYVWSEVNP